MADSVNPYLSALSPYFPNSTGQEYKQDANKVTHYFIYFNNEKSLTTLLATQTCQIDPQDSCGFTPLHHAAVNNFQNIISLLLQNGANSKLTNKRNGTYLQVLNLVHPKIDPAAQKFKYRHPETGVIVEGNGTQFQQLTGAQTFLDKESVMSVGESVKEWSIDPIPEQNQFPALTSTLQEAYQQFLKNPPSIYLEKHSHAGGNICSEEEILPGTIVAEYLGEIKYQDPSQETTSMYRFAHLEAEKMRGSGAMINDGFPNCAPFAIPNTSGVLNRTVICATSRISKGDSITYDYGINQPIKFNRHFELCDKQMTEFFKNHKSSDALIKEFQNCLRNIQQAKTGSALLSSMGSLNKLFYLTSTPHAILKLVCDQTLSVEQIQYLFQASPPENPERAQAVLQFILLIQNFSGKLQNMDPAQAMKCRTKVLEKLPNMNIAELMNLLKNPPEALLTSNS